MEDYKNLTSIDRKARDAEQRLNCGKCPVYGNCYPSMQEACDYIFRAGFRYGYSKRKKDEKELQRKATERCYRNFMNIENIDKEL